MEYKVILTPAALQDLREIEMYIATDDPSAAGEMRERLLDKARKLRRLPARGGLIRRTPEVRFLVYKSYLVVYSIAKERGVVRILRYWHSARDIKRLRLP